MVLKITVTAISPLGPDSSSMASALASELNRVADCESTLYTLCKHDIYPLFTSRPGDDSSVSLTPGLVSSAATALSLAAKYTKCARLVQRTIGNATKEVRQIASECLPSASGGTQLALSLLARDLLTEPQSKSLAEKLSSQPGTLSFTMAEILCKCDLPISIDDIVRAVRRSNFLTAFPFIYYAYKRGVIDGDFFMTSYVFAIAADESHHMVPRSRQMKKLCIELLRTESLPSAIASRIAIQAGARQTQSLLQQRGDTLVVGLLPKLSPEQARFGLTALIELLDDSEECQSAMNGVTAALCALVSVSETADCALRVLTVLVSSVIGRNLTASGIAIASTALTTPLARSLSVPVRSASRAVIDCFVVQAQFLALIALVSLVFAQPVPQVKAPDASLVQWCPAGSVALQAICLAANPQYLISLGTEPCGLSAVVLTFVCGLAHVDATQPAIFATRYIAHGCPELSSVTTLFTRALSSLATPELRAVGLTLAETVHQAASDASVFHSLRTVANSVFFNDMNGVSDERRVLALVAAGLSFSTEYAGHTEITRLVVSEKVPSTVHRYVSESNSLAKSLAVEIETLWDEQEQFNHVAQAAALATSIREEVMTSLEPSLFASLLASLDSITTEMARVYLTAEGEPSGVEYHLDDAVEEEKERQRVIIQQKLNSAKKAAMAGGPRVTVDTTIEHEDSIRARLSLQRDTETRAAVQATQQKILSTVGSLMPLSITRAVQSVAVRLCASPLPALQLAGATVLASVLRDMRSALGLPSQYPEQAAALLCRTNSYYSVNKLDSSVLGGAATLVPAECHPSRDLMAQFLSDEEELCSCVLGALQSSLGNGSLPARAMWVLWPVIRGVLTADHASSSSKIQAVSVLCRQVQQRADGVNVGDVASVLLTLLANPVYTSHISDLVQEAVTAIAAVSSTSDLACDPVAVIQPYTESLTVTQPIISLTALRAMGMLPYGVLPVSSVDKLDVSGLKHIVIPIAVTAAGCGASARLACTVSVGERDDEEALEEQSYRSMRHMASEALDSLVLNISAAESDAGHGLHSVLSAFDPETLALALVDGLSPYFSMVTGKVGTDEFYYRPQARAAVGAVSILLEGLDAAVVTRFMTLCYERYMQSSPSENDRLRKYDPPQNITARQAYLAAAFSALPFAVALSSFTEASTLIRNIFETAVYDFNDDVRVALRRFVMVSMRTAVSRAAEKGVSFFSSTTDFLSEWAAKHEGGEDQTDDFAWTILCTILGHSASALPQGDARKEHALSTLVKALSVPSMTVQAAAAQAATLLFSAKQSQAHTRLISQWRATLEKYDSFSLLRGACCGLAATTRVSGTCWLFSSGLLQWISGTGPEHALALLTLVECLATVVEQAIEPFASALLQPVLGYVSNSSEQLSKAAIRSIDAVVGQLTRFGAGSLLPEVSVWCQSSDVGTVLGALRVVVSISKTSPAVAASALPQCFPPLRQAAISPNRSISSAARQVLTEVASVIRNRDIRPILPLIVNALIDPINDNSPALRALADTQFSAQLDAPSLAIVEPVVLRGFVSRSPTDRQSAASILTTICHLCMPSDLTPYSDELLPGLREAVCDPVDRTRALVAQSFAALLPSLMPRDACEVMDWACGQLRSETASGREAVARVISAFVGATERAAANRCELLDAVPLMHLREIDPRFSAVFWLNALDEAVLHDSIPILFDNLKKALNAHDSCARATCSPDAAERERAVASVRPRDVKHGHFVIVPFLSEDLGEDFAIHQLARVLPSVVELLGDKDEMLQATAQTVASALISSFVLSRETLTSAISVLVQSLSSESSESRSGVMMVLVKTIGRVVQVDISINTTQRDAKIVDIDIGKNPSRQPPERKKRRAERDPEETRKTAPQYDSESISSKLRAALGDELYDDLYSSIFIGRSDLCVTARTNANQIWRITVPNSQQTIEYLLPHIKKKADELIARFVNAGDENNEDYEPDENLHSLALMGALAVVDLSIRGGSAGRQAWMQTFAHCGQVFSALPSMDGQHSLFDRASSLLLCEALVQHSASTRTTIQQYCRLDEEQVPALVPEGGQSLELIAVRALCDPSIIVRTEALTLFNLLAGLLGPQYLRFSVPLLLNASMDISAATQLPDAPESATVLAQAALDGLFSVLETRSDLVSQLLPLLMRPPITAQNAKALATLAQIIGSSRFEDKSVQELIPSVLQTLGTFDGAKDAQASAALLDDSASSPSYLLRACCCILPRGESQASVNFGQTTAQNIQAILYRALVAPPLQVLGCLVLIRSWLSVYPIGIQTFRGSWEVLLGSTTLLLQCDEPIVYCEALKAITALLRATLQLYATNQEILPNYITGLQGRLQTMVAGTQRIPAFDNEESTSNLLEALVAILNERTLQQRTRVATAELLLQLLQLTPRVGPSYRSIIGLIIRMLTDKDIYEAAVPLLNCATALIDKDPAQFKPFAIPIVPAVCRAVSTAEQRAVGLAAAELAARVCRIHMRPEAMLLDILKNALSAPQPALEASLRMIGACVRDVPGVLPGTGSTLRSMSALPAFTASEIVCASDPMNLRRLIACFVASGIRDIAGSAPFVSTSGIMRQVAAELFASLVLTAPIEVGFDLMTKLLLSGDDAASAAAQFTAIRCIFSDAAGVNILAAASQSFCDVLTDLLVITVRSPSSSAFDYAIDAAVPVVASLPFTAASSAESIVDALLSVMSLNIPAISLQNIVRVLGHILSDARAIISHCPELEVQVISALLDMMVYNNVGVKKAAEEAMARGLLLEETRSLAHPKELAQHLPANTSERFLRITERLLSRIDSGALVLGE